MITSERSTRPFFGRKGRKNVGFPGIFQKQDINRGVEEYRAAENAVLLDVRERGEYESGHIPGSHNLPLSSVSQAPALIRDKAAPVFVYCLSGGRSSAAASALRSMGYTDVHDIGGIRAWRGEVER